MSAMLSVPVVAYKPPMATSMSALPNTFITRYRNDAAVA